MLFRANCRLHLGVHDKGELGGAYGWLQFDIQGTCAILVKRQQSRYNNMVVLTLPWTVVQLDPSTQALTLRKAFLFRCTSSMVLAWLTSSAAFPILLLWPPQNLPYMIQHALVFQGPFPMLSMFNAYSLDWLSSITAPFLLCIHNRYLQQCTEVHDHLVLPRS